MTSTSPQFRALMVSAERRASTKYQAGRDVLRVVHLSQPITWALLWNTAVNNFLQDPKSLSFFFLSLFAQSLQNQPPSPCNYFNSSGESKEMEYSSSLSLCFTEESLQNCAQNLTLKEKLMWAVRRKKGEGGLWKGLWVGVGLSNCKRARECADTHHALVKTWLPVISLRRVFCCSPKVCLHSDRPFLFPSSRVQL